MFKSLKFVPFVSLRGKAFVRNISILYPKFRQLLEPVGFLQVCDVVVLHDLRVTKDYVNYAAFVRDNSLEQFSCAVWGQAMTAQVEKFF